MEYILRLFHYPSVSSSVLPLSVYYFQRYPPPSTPLWCLFCSLSRIHNIGGIPPNWPLPSMSQDVRAVPSFRTVPPEASSYETILRVQPGNHRPSWPILAFSNSSRPPSDELKEPRVIIQLAFSPLLQSSPPTFLQRGLCDLISYQNSSAIELTFPTCLHALRSDPHTPDL